MKTAIIVAITALLAAAAFGQGQSQPSSPQGHPVVKPTEPAKGAEPDHVTVQHILIGFQGSVPGKNITRTLDEAKKLAYEILDRAKKGEDFDAMVKKYTDDAYPGIYSMANNGVAPGKDEFPRRGMVAAFGDTGFPLKVGEIDIADHDPQRSPYGYHIVKRTK